MILPKPVVFVVGVILAIAEAVQQYLHMAGYVHALVAVLVVFFGALMVHALDPATIRSKIPLHIATLLTAFLAALNAVQQLGIDMPKGVQVAIGVIIVIGSTIGINVTGPVLSKSARRAMARRGPGTAPTASSV